MSETESHSFLNPLTLEANIFLQTLEKYGACKEFQVLDQELLITLDKMVDALNKFYDKAITRIEETDGLKLIRAKDTGCLVKLYQCTTCHQFLGTNPERAVRHFQIKHTNFNSEKRRKKRNTNTSEEATGIQLPKKARFLLAGKISKDLRTYFTAGEKLKKMPEYDLIENDLISMVQSLYPDKSIKTYKFGSRISGIGNMESDLDIFVDMDGSFYDFNYRPTAQILEINKEVSNALRKDNRWSQVIPINNARVPIIRLKHVSTKVNCDVGFSNSLGYSNTMLMQYYFELQPIAQRMCIVIKEWLERTRLSENVSTYSFTLMVIYYLQMSFLLPSVEDLQKDLEKPEYIGPWITNFNKKSLSELNLEAAEVTKASIREHMYNFFVFYGEFDYKKCVICPYKGVIIDYDNLVSNLPERYENFIKTSESHVQSQLIKPIIVLDPIELSHNVTKGISKAMLKVLVKFFMESAKVLSNNEAEKIRQDDVLNADNDKSNDGDEIQNSE